MQIGLALPQIGHFASPDAVRHVAVGAEHAGFASLWALDRLLAPIAPRSPYPGSPDGLLPAAMGTALDPLVVLGLAAAVTTRIRVGTNVLVAPWYPPMLLARSLASLDRVSDGRLDVGLGLGWSVDEYAAVGVPQARLHTRIEEVLDVMEAAWDDGLVAVETRREAVAPSVVGVKPVQRPRPPILLAAFSPAGLERIGRRADGWTPAGLPHDVIAPMWATVRATASGCGRDPDALRLVVRANVAVVEDRRDADRPPFVGSLAQIRADVERTEALGAHELVLDLQGVARQPEELLDTAELLTRTATSVAG